MIVVEGPDNSGKSTLTKELGNQLLSSVSTIGPKPNSHYELMMCMSTQLIRAKNYPALIIQDRLTCISQQIYRNLVGDPTMQSFCQAMTQTSLFLIYCRPPDDAVLDMSKHEVKEYDTAEHLKFLQADHEKIVRRYDGFMTNYMEPDFVFDYTKHSVHDVVKSIKERFR